MLGLEDYLDALRTATARMIADATEPPRPDNVDWDDEPTSEDADWDAISPTAPEWSVRQVVAHQGMVHRWATGVITGRIDISAGPEVTDLIEAEGMNTPDPGGWLQRGSEALEWVLRGTAEDADIPFFLRNAGAPRDAWARRQAHETTIHWIDVYAARLGSAPDSSGLDIPAEFAADGVDELLRGFLPRSKSGMRTARDVVVAVHATDTGDTWTMRLGSAPPEFSTDAADNPDCTWHATAVQLYAGLWNRGDQIVQDGLDVLSVWRERAAVAW
ncbi:uncharacterized protein (TIGR03083 family) [Branchiibius hedensis]|uniref:TIGR03083 family protein n=1 Tax=Branchiibius hedensis TaxID=672460 RepID=A0A2Y8ZTL9_9MICO|nr:maleylpyruvate isomerase family mycothiol-dependent enzyme [Branchiibius hedensis]PWJ25795.1 uncharacterized protein (TIGR03083 family) [Branchiibius hedensis]SSA34608.1 TIGR03083 family protein [Branchiibius hedensis]